jgi:hypothetical protein
MNRIDSERLWGHVQGLLRQPSPPDDHDLRRAARMLASARSDAVELLLAQWLVQAREADSAAQPVAGPEREAGLAVGLGPASAPASARFGLREAALVTAGLAGGALLTELLGADDGIDTGLGIE